MFAPSRALKIRVLKTGRRHVRAFALAVALGTGAGLAAPPRESAAQALSAVPAGAPVQVRDLVRAEILPGWETERGTRMVALHLRLAEGWKTYWRIPGEAGIAPRLDFSGSQNLADVRVHWPRPSVFDQSGYTSIGYLGELILPLELIPRRAGRPIALEGEISIGVCDDICVPADLRVQAALRGPGAPDPAIQRALARTAEPAGVAGLSAARCALAPGRRGMDLTLRATLPRLGQGEHMVIELPGSGYWISDSRTWREGGDLLAQARVRAPNGQPVTIDRSALSFTVLSGERMVEHRGCLGG